MTATLRRPRRARTLAHPRLDRSLGLWRTGYPYLMLLRRRWGAATAELRLLGRRTTVVSGPDGVRLFYDEAVMRRRGALPRPLLSMLFGRGAVHGLDDAEHAHRKELFLRLLTPQAASAIAAIADHLWRAPQGERSLDPVGVFDEAVEVHCAAVCRWAGVPADAVDLPLGRDLVTMVDGFGSVGPRHLRGRRARRRANRWSRRLVARVRGGHRRIDPASPLAVIATATGPDGRRLPARVAGVELLNVLRPTVAVAYFVAFAAHALATRPGLPARMAVAGDDAYEAFAHELRRYYPFVPMLAARVRRPVTVDGRRLPAGRRVLLDVYGTLHDPQVWADPDVFDPGRFLGSAPDQEAFVPQGGGEPSGHRCPGERVAVELIKSATRHLAGLAPAADDDLEIPLNRLPTRPIVKE